MTTIPQNDAGMPMSATESFKTIQLITGDTPHLSTTDEVVADALVASVDLPAYSVVGRDNDGKLVMAQADGSPLAIGITTQLVKTGATAKNVAVYRSGCFNPDALNWDASYDTAEKKRRAFEGTGADILIKKVGYEAAL